MNIAQVSRQFYRAFYNNDLILKWNTLFPWKDFNKSKNNLKQEARAARQVINDFVNYKID